MITNSRRRTRAARTRGVDLSLRAAAALALATVTLLAATLPATASAARKQRPEICIPSGGGEQADGSVTVEAECYFLDNGGHPAPPREPSPNPRPFDTRGYSGAGVYGGWEPPSPECEYEASVVAMASDLAALVPLDAESQERHRRELQAIGEYLVQRGWKRTANGWSVPVRCQIGVG